MQSVLTFVTTKPLTREGFARRINNTHNLSNPAALQGKYCSTWFHLAWKSWLPNNNNIVYIIILFMGHTDAFTNLEYLKSIAWHSQIFFPFVGCEFKKCFGPFFFSHMVGVSTFPKFNLFIYLLIWFKVSKINKISQPAPPISFSDSAGITFYNFIWETLKCVSMICGSI